LLEVVDVVFVVDVGEEDVVGYVVVNEAVDGRCNY